METIFSKIIAWEIPCYRVYEDEYVLAFLDINPLNKGHTLLIPKDYARRVWDIPNIAEFYQAAHKIAHAQQKAFDTERVVSVVLGDLVPHAHLHLIPRFEKDWHGSSIHFGNIKSFSPEEMQEIANRIKEKL